MNPLYPYRVTYDIDILLNATNCGNPSYLLEIDKLIFFGILEH